MATLHVFVSRICTVAFGGRLLHSITRRPKLCRSCGSWTVIAPNAGACCDSRTGYGCVVGRVIDCRPSLGRLTLIGTRPGAHRLGCALQADGETSASGTDRPLANGFKSSTPLPEAPARRRPRS